jgi:hypothetical protein
MQNCLFGNVGPLMPSKLLKKGIFDGLYKQPQGALWVGVSKKGNFDGLCKQVM